ncbi:putative CocE/NonD family hydrolase [Sphingobium sp. B2D3A]|uniref:CocE/NonD family hydrolase n=1 Tax=unclassified Sphingobium TaxID=2611147 RepID=UPI0022254FB3|nr:MULTISPECIES: CocE/NonD family hydrolase [unclassified Sphingobium]MCW2336057.1 putative CocE/NonD family hydrolase [Sphingobium sp. B2D3A]MCW2385815.1 putative CocE/NonD family hydrolase [Sphingobium sp. B2D3D]
MRAVGWIGALAAVTAAVPGPARDYADVQRSSLYVPVRDGTKLAVNIYRPASEGKVEEKRLPVIFVFTPYRARFKDKDGAIREVALEDGLALRSLISAGYVVAVADIRGKGASFGARRGFQDRTEAKDGHDLVEWLASQSFSTGKVGMIGCSYLGGTTFHTATTTPPALKAVFIGASDLDKYAFVRRGGITAQFNTRPDEPLSDDLASVPVDGDADGQQLKSAVAQHAQNTPMAALWYGMPYRDSVSSFTGNRFWEEVGVYNYLDAIQRTGIATYFWSNWHDEPTAQSLLSAANLKGSKFLAGPGSHCVPPPGFDFTGEVVRYFDHYLKGADNGIEKEPRATYWVEGLDGKGGYARSDALPGAKVTPMQWFLNGGRSGTARSVNDGTLGAKPDRAGADKFTVRYDLPGADYFAFWAKPMDDKGLSYTSAPLDEPLKLIGYPVVNLRVSADKPDADVFVYLDQVAADGQAEVVAFGRLALAHRKTGKAPYHVMGLPWHSGRKADVAPLPVGQQANLAIDLTPVSRIVPAGARLRVTIAGADPRQRNLKEIQQTPAPVFTVERGSAGGSWVKLPVAN